MLRDTTKPAPARKAAAAAIWRKLLVPKPNDPVTTAQVADLLRQAELTDLALALYQKAAELAPANPQYYEYIGEYLHNLKRPDEAKAAWSKIADGTNKNAKNLARLAEVLAGFGYLKEAVPSLTEAVTLDADNFAYRLKLADYLHRLERYDPAETELAAARKLAEKDEEKDAVVAARVKNDLAAGRVARRIEALQKELNGAKTATAEQWDILARYLEADGKLPEAVRAAEQAIQVEPRSIPAWTLAARVRESAGNLADAADALRRLAEIDRRNRTEHLTGIAKLETRLGRIDAALKAGRDLLAAAPGNPEHYEFFAQLCFQLGKPEEGLEALRRAMRVNPNDTKTVLSLAETLAGQFQTEEAIEQYWRAFDRAAELDQRLDVVRRLTELYLQRNQFDRLLTRLQHSAREERPAVGASPARERDVAMCMAQALATSGDLGGARAELERLLAANNRDPHLLNQLSKLAEEEGDLESAGHYQQKLIEMAPSDDGSTRLAQLYSRAGEMDLAQAVWSKMAAGKSGTYRVYQAIDSLLTNQKAQPVDEITESMVRKDPRDWEALYRCGVALAALQKPDQACKRFEALLALRIDDDEKSAFAKARARNPHLQATGARAASGAAAVSAAMPDADVPLEQRIGMTYVIRRACNLDGPTSRPVAWSPEDFGQARMATLGWLLSFEQQHKATPPSPIAAIERAAEKGPADVHALWDWFYLCQMRYDNAALFEAARKLSRAAATDPIAMWAYLHVMGGRQLPPGREFGFSQQVSILAQLTAAPGQEESSPLESAELDHMVACYHSLRARRPDLPGALVLLNISDELKRAKRLDQDERFYRDALAGATRIGQVAGAFVLAARRGDAAGLMQLFERYDRLQTGRSQSRLSYYTQTFSFVGPGLAMSQGMSALADRKDYAGVLHLLDFNLAFARRKQELQSPGAARRALRARYAALGYAGYVPVSYAIWVGRTIRRVSVPFPQVNEYFDGTVIQVLRTAHELYQRDDLSSDLIGHFRRHSAAARSPRDVIYPGLALASLLWWGNEQDEAIADLGKVVEAAPVESELRLDLAELLEQRRGHAEALAVADAVQPLDNMTLRRREELALRLAVNSGDADRARHAAERLFGLRLDTETQISLAGQMHQLGLHEMADAVLGRARRRAGNKADALVGLMLQYERQGKADEAAQVAMQLLRSSARPGQGATARAVDDSESARTAAMSVLAGSGRLAQLITRAQDELKKTPNSVQIHQALADYYTAARDSEKAANELARLAELRPEDAGLRLRVASQLARSGQMSLALGHYKAAFQKDPVMAARSYRPLENMLLQGGRMADLLRLLAEIDLRVVGNALTVGRLIQQLPERPELAEQVRSLYRRIWDAFPEQRVQLLVYVRRDDVWRMPEMYEWVRTVIVPNTLPDPGLLTTWYSFMPIGPVTNPTVGTLSSEIIQPPISRFLDLAASQGRLGELTSQVEAAQKRLSSWAPAHAILALIHLRAGALTDVRTHMLKVFDHFKTDPVDRSVVQSLYTLWTTGNELTKEPATRDLAATAFEEALASPFALISFRFAIDDGPGGRLVDLCLRAGRPADARNTLLKMVRSRNFPPQYDSAMVRQLRMAGLPAVGRELIKLGYPGDAVPLFQEALALDETPEEFGSRMLAGPAFNASAVREDLDRALNGMDRGELAAIAGQSIAAAIESGPAIQTPSERQSDTSSPPDQVIDLAPLIHPRELDKANVRSLLAESLAASDAAQLAVLDQPLETLRKGHPEDLSVAITTALQALATGDSHRIEPALTSLSALVERSPLEPLPPGTRANARQRTEAARFVPLWLVSRACAGQSNPAIRAAATRLAARAHEAAGRQTDTRWLLAMLRERGQHALDDGDRRTAEAAWGQMLNMVLTPEPASVQRPRFTRPAGAPARSQRNSAQPPDAPGSGKTVAPLGSGANSKAASRQ